MDIYLFLVSFLFSSSNCSNCLRFGQWMLFFPNFIVVQVQFSAFSPYPSLTPSPPHLPPISTPSPPPIIIHVSFIIVPTNPAPFSPKIPSPLRSSHSWPVLNLSVWLYFACLFVLLIRFLLRSTRLISVSSLILQWLIYNCTSAFIICWILSDAFSAAI